MAQDPDEWPVQSIENGLLRLDFFTHAGPRIIRLIVANTGENLFAELPTAKIDSAAGEFKMYGGHRLWHSPEASPRTYIPDDMPPQIQANGRSVQIIQEIEHETGIQKSVQVELAEHEPFVTVTHRLTNRGLWPVELAAWAITQLPLGGVVILPDQIGPLDPQGLLANRSLTLWPYTRWHDDRLQLEDRYLLLHARSQLPPVKIGYFNRQGWSGYYRNGTFFCKHINVQHDQHYPDFGCNTESYCNHLFIELETLGPLTRLDPEQSVEHIEYWQIFNNLDYPATLAGMTAMAKALGLAGD